MVLLSHLVSKNNKTMYVANPTSDTMERLTMVTIGALTFLSGTFLFIMEITINVATHDSM